MSERSTFLSRYEAETLVDLIEKHAPDTVMLALAQHLRSTWGMNTAAAATIRRECDRDQAGSVDLNPASPHACLAVGDPQVIVGTSRAGTGTTP